MSGDVEVGRCTQRVQTAWLSNRFSFRKFWSSLGSPPMHDWAYKTVLSLFGASTSCIEQSGWAVVGCEN